MKNHTSKGIVYCRVSSHEQVQGTSLENQERACLRFAETKGIDVEKIFIEKGESATAANRTEFMKALEYCRKYKKRVSAFIVWKIDRFARNTTDHFAVRAKLLQYGVTVHSVTEPISQDPQGKLMETLLAGFAEFENEVRKQRCTAGLQSRLREGIWCWKPPIGYIQSKKITDRRKTMPDQPDPERFYLIQKALKEYTTGEYTILALTDAMNKWGLRSRTGKPMFKQLTEKMLRDKFYAGILVDPWTGEEYAGQHKSMISLEEYNQIKFIKNNQSRLKNIPHLALHPDFPLRRFVRCTCNGKMTGSWRKGYSKKYAYYSCNNRKCEHYSHGIPKKILEDKFIELLRQITPKDRILKLFEASVIEVWENRKVATKQEKDHYGQQLRQLEIRKEQLLQMRVNNEISKEEFLKLKDRLENQMTGIKISKNEAQIEELDLEAAVSYTVQFLRNLARLWKDMNDVKQKQRLQRIVLPENITYNKTTETFGTAVLSPLFTLLSEFKGDESDFVAGVGRIWHGLVSDLKEIRALFSKNDKLREAA